MISRAMHRTPVNHAKTLQITLRHPSIRIAFFVSHSGIYCCQDVVWGIFECFGDFGSVNIHFKTLKQQEISNHPQRRNANRVKISFLFLLLISKNLIYLMLSTADIASYFFNFKFTFLLLNPTDFKQMLNCFSHSVSNILSSTLKTVYASCFSTQGISVRSHTIL